MEWQRIQLDKIKCLSSLVGFKLSLPLNTMWDIHTMEFHSGIKKNEVLIHATIWMNLDNIMLSEINWTSKVKYCKISLKKYLDQADS